MRGAAALLFVLGACAGDTGPRLTRFEIDHVDVIRGSAESARSNLPEVLAVLTRTGEGVEIRGMIPLRHPCDDVRGALLLDSAGPTPIVESREPARHRVGCDGPDRLSIAHYQATLGSLRRGCLRVRVRHEYPHGRAPAIPSQPWVFRVVADRWTSPPPNPPD